MKKYIVLALLLTSLVSFPMNSIRYHTWFLLRKCAKSSAFETQERVNFLNLLASCIEIKEKDTVVLANDDLLHQGTLVTGFTSLVSPKGVIFCTAIPYNSMAIVDIFTDEMNFNKRDVGEVCKAHFGAKSHDLAYTIPHELTHIIKKGK